MRDCGNMVVVGVDDVVRNDDLLYLRGVRSGGRLWLDRNSGLTLRLDVV